MFNEVSMFDEDAVGGITDCRGTGISCTFPVIRVQKVVLNFVQV